MIVSFKHNNVNYFNWDISDSEVRAELENKGIDLVPIVKEEIKKQLLLFSRKRLNKVLDEYGYYSLGDIQFYASQNDAEAQSLLNWYQTYDDAVWNYIDNDLQALTTIDGFLALDLRQAEQQIFEQSIQSAPLP